MQKMLEGFFDLAFFFGTSAHFDPRSSSGLITGLSEFMYCEYSTSSKTSVPHPVLLRHC